MLLEEALILAEKSSKLFEKRKNKVGQA